MAIRRKSSDASGRGKSSGYRRDEKPAGSSSYFKKKDADGDDSGKSVERRYGSRGEGAPSERSSFRDKKDFGDKPPRKSYGDRDERSTARPSRGSSDFGDRPPRKSFGDRDERSSARPSRGSRDFGDKPPRKSFGDRDERSSARPARGSRDFGDRPERKSFGDRDERSSARPARGSRDFGDKPPRKSFGDRDERSSEPKSFRGKKEFGDKPFKKSFGDRDERSSEPKSFRGKKEFGDKPFKKSFGDRDEQSADRPTFRGKKEFGDKPFKKSFGDRDEQSADRPTFRGKKEFGDKPFKKSFGERGDFKERKSFNKPYKSKRNVEPKEDDGTRRLNKFIANSGICSRREADEYITAGLVSVNGEVVTALGTKVKLTDDIRYNGERIKTERLVYVLLNKPKDYITTTDDPQQRKTVMELVASTTKVRVYPVGLLDRNTTGLLLMTNDGELADKLMHPSTDVKKTYMVELNKNLKLADMQAIADGVELEDGLMQVDEIAFDEAAGKKNVIGVTIRSGRNRVIRRLFEHLGYMVVKLDRTYYAGLTKRDLPRGRCRHLEQIEINMLKMVKAR